MKEKTKASVSNGNIILWDQLMCKSIKKALAKFSFVENSSPESES